MMKLRKIVPANSFLGKWFERMSRLETAESFDFWTAMWLLSYVCGRRAYIDRPMAPLHLNLFCVLVSESGVGRKSTAINAAMDVAEKLREQITELPELLTGHTTSEQFDYVLGRLSSSKGEARIAIAIPEMARFLGRNSGARTLPVLLTDLFDCPRKRVIYGTKGEEQLTVVNAWVSLLTGCAPAWLDTQVHPAILEGGFSSRTIFVVAEKNKNEVSWPDDTDNVSQDEIVASLVEIFHEIEADSKIVMTKGGLAAFDTWYKHRASARSHYERIFESREPDHILRVAALLSINDRSFEISNQHILNAIDVIAEVKNHLSTLFIEGSPLEQRLANGIERVRSILDESRPGMVGHRDLYQRVRTYMSSAQFCALIPAMHTLGMIEVLQQKNSQLKCYKATTHIRGSGKLQELVRVVSHLPR